MKYLLVLLAAIACTTAQNYVDEMENPNPQSVIDNPKAERFVQGDMIMTGEEEESLRTGIAYGSVQGKSWKADRIPYFIESTLSSDSRAVQVIKEAIADYHKYTCLRFVPKTSSDKAYFSFYRGGGCSSYVGYRGVVNRISLARGCWYKGIVMHEMGHSLGLHHEQSRPDRDNHVEIIWGNIANGMGYNFQIMKGIDSLGTPYDFSSMMHYGRTAFGSGRTTIKTKDPANQNKIGQRAGFSVIDKKQINLMYKCGTQPTGGPEPTGAPTKAPTQAPTQSPGGCKDTDSRCPHWKSYCNTNSYVKKHCLKTCNRCGGGTCADNHQGGTAQCQKWLKY
jgi:hypothetical protein